VLAGIDRCLKRRPPLDQTLPPPPDPNGKHNRDR
jgi:hypothetical protein